MCTNYSKNKMLSAKKQLVANRSMEQNRDSEIYPHKCTQLTFDKRAKAVEESKDYLFNE